MPRRWVGSLHQALPARPAVLARRALIRPARILRRRAKGRSRAWGRRPAGRCVIPMVAAAQLFGVELLRESPEPGWASYRRHRACQAAAGGGPRRIRRMGYRPARHRPERPRSGLHRLPGGHIGSGAPVGEPGWEFNVIVSFGDGFRAQAVPGAGELAPTPRSSPGCMIDPRARRTTVASTGYRFDLIHWARFRCLACRCTSWATGSWSWPNCSAPTANAGRDSCRTPGPGKTGSRCSTVCLPTG